LTPSVPTNGIGWATDGRLGEMTRVRHAALRHIAPDLAVPRGPMTAELLFFCRAGFEPEIAAETAARAAALGFAGYPQTDRGQAYVRFAGLSADAAAALDRGLPWRSLIFARQKLLAFADLRALPTSDRLTPMLAALRERGERYGTLWVEHPDSDQAKPLAGLARSFANALRPALRKAGLLALQDDEQAPRLHVVFLAGDHALLARSAPTDSAPWPLGIPRLRLAHDAPSRSALKLEEAFLTLLDAGERERWLKPGMRAADLGAAPGGWSWVLARAGLQVTAIDNGPLAESALATGQIRHLRADGFSWQPQQPLDWMVCDMVEQPRRVAARMAEWFAQGWCRRSVFNLKLPMKKRYAEVEANLADFVARCADAGVAVEWRARQLYHDREEITVYAGPSR
jgi:23S rRNA (cytidine2498-2'-O)-methyltransferase